MLLCAPIHIGRYPSSVAQFLIDWKDALSQVPTALVSVSLGIHSGTQEGHVADAGDFDRILECHKDPFTGAFFRLKVKNVDFFEVDFINDFALGYFIVRMSGDDL